MYKIAEEKVLSVGYEREDEYITRTDEEIEKAMKSAAGNLKHSGMIVTEEEKELLKRKLRGEIFEDQFMETILKSIGVDKTKTPSLEDTSDDIKDHSVMDRRGKGITVSELIEELKKLPGDAKVKAAHFYRIGEAVRNRDIDILGVAPCFDADTGKLLHLTIQGDIRYDEI